jgi:hypothetical protein
MANNNETDAAMKQRIITEVNDNLTVARLLEERDEFDDAKDLVDYYEIFDPTCERVEHKIGEIRVDNVRRLGEAVIAAREADPDDVAADDVGDEPLLTSNEKPKKKTPLSGKVRVRNHRAAVVAANPKAVDEYVAATIAKGETPSPSGAAAAAKKAAKAVAEQALDPGAAARARDLATVRLSNQIAEEYDLTTGDKMKAIPKALRAILDGATPRASALTCLVHGLEKHIADTQLWLIDARQAEIFALENEAASDEAAAQSFNEVASVEPPTQSYGADAGATITE